MQSWRQLVRASRQATAEEKEQRADELQERQEDATIRAAMGSNVDMRREHASIRAGFVWNPDHQEELFQQEQLDEQQEEES